MSHKATGWLADVDDVTPSEFRILFILCDCHNPSKGCFPSQGYLQTKSGMSNGSINNQLNSLETKGLIKRERRVDQTTKQRMSTLYHLGFDIVKPSPNIGVGAISNLGPKPSPNNGQSHLQFLETNYVREPCKEPVIKIDFGIFWGIWPNRVAKPKAKSAWDKLKAEDHHAIMALPSAGFEAWQSAAPQGANPVHPASFLNGRRWEDTPILSNGGHNGTRNNNGTPQGTQRTDPALEQIARLAGIGEAQGNGGH